MNTGEWKVRVDLDDNSADPREHFEIMLDKIETVLQGRADADVLSYSINGRSLSILQYSKQFYLMKMFLLLLIANDNYLFQNYY